MKKISLLTAIFLIIAFAAKSNTFTVVTSVDAGPGSLRDAIAQSNVDTVADTIVISLPSTAVIYALSPYVISNDYGVLITGLTCANPTINGSNAGTSSPLISVSSEGVPLTLSYLNFTGCTINGFGGGYGAAVNAEILYLNYCYFYSNSVVAGIGPNASGGAVSAEDLTAWNCTFSNNSAGVGGSGSGTGGAAVVGSSAYFYNCTFYHNQAGSFGSALDLPSSGNIINCTFQGNKVVGNSGGGAIYCGAQGGNSLYVANNVFWGNTSAGPFSCIWFDVNTFSGGCNILQAQTDNTGFVSSPTDVFGTNPLLGNFGYFGGCIPVIPLGCGSIAQDHASCQGATTFDADNVPASGIRDAGAFELPEYIPNLGPNIVQCGGSVNLQATIPVSIDTYVWSTGQTTDNIVVSTSGNYRVVVSDVYGCSASDSITVYIEPVPAVNLGNAITQCAGTVVLNAGNANDLYVWSTTETTQTITVSATNSYSVTVTDANSGCTASGGTTVTINPLPVVNLGGPYTQCGSSVTLNALNGGSTYNWSDGSTGQTLTTFASGFYEVTVTNGNNCSGFGSSVVTINPVPSVYLPADTTVCGSKTVLDAGSGSDYSYVWQDQTTNETDTAIATGNYSVTVTNGYNCSASAQSNVTLLNAPVINFTNVNQCGGPATVNAGNAGDTYAWSDGSTGQILTAATSGTYIVTVTDPSTCSATGSVQIYIRTLPFVSLGNDTTQCGGAVLLNAGNSGDTYSWSNGATTKTISAGATGNYAVTVTDPNGGCSASDAINVTILPLPLVYLGPDTTQCGGVVGLFAGNPGSSYLWSNGSTIDSTVVAVSGLYSVTVTNAANCSAQGSINVYIEIPPTVYLGQNITACGGPVTLDAGNPGYNYLWSNSATSQTTSVTVSATYGVTVTNPLDNCGASDTIKVVIDTIPVVNLGPDTVQCGGTIALNAANTGATYLWSDNSNGQLLLVSSTGVYRVTVTSSANCSATGSIGVTINPVPVVTLSLAANICNTVPPFLLTGGSPVGGNYYEADTLISVFNPGVQGVGPHEITYVYTNSFSCTASDSASVYVRPQPAIAVTNLPYLCTNSSELNLNNYFNPGGVFSGVGVSANFLYPNLIPPGNVTVTDIYTDSLGCMDTAKLTTNIHPAAHVVVTSSVADFTICQTQSITFTATGATDYQFLVNGVAQGPSSVDSTFTTTTLTNQAIITVIGSNPCSTDTSEPMLIDVIAPPVVNAGSDTTIILGQSVELNGQASGVGNLTYLWTPDTYLTFNNVPNPVYSGPDSITFWFKATDYYGCADSAQVSVYVFVPDNILLPNLITPNGDGFNDVWKLNPKLNLDGSHLVIFDRWGQLVYETDNYANDWGGTYKSTGKVLPDDTYYYVLKAPAMHNHVYEGPINIISGNTK